MAVPVKDAVKATQQLVSNSEKSNNSVVFNPELFYDVRPANWYQTFPFFFEIKDGSNKKNPETLLRFFLPIPPQNMTVQDMSTSEAHATIGGVVEETSKGVFNIITLVGTTGLSPEAHTTGPQAEELDVSFRKYIDDLTGQIVNPLVNLVSGLFSPEGTLPYHDQGSAISSTNLQNEAENRIQEITSAPEEAKRPDLSFLGREKSAFTSLFTDENYKKYRSIYANGHTWSQSLRQTFLIYQREKAQNPNLQLYFTDVKTGTKYRCVVRSAQFTKNSRDPYTINYNLSLKCWDIGNVDKQLADSAIDRFGPGGDLEDVFSVTAAGAVTAISSDIRQINRVDGAAGALAKVDALQGF